MIQSSNAAEIESFVDSLLWSAQQGGHHYALACLRFNALLDVATHGPGFEHGIVLGIGAQIDLIPLAEDPVHQAGLVRLSVLKLLARNGSFG